jgi:hypothetical protein
MDFDNCKGFVRGNEPPEERARKYTELLKETDEEAMLMVRVVGTRLQFRNEQFKRRGTHSGTAWRRRRRRLRVGISRLPLTLKSGVWCVRPCY